MKESVYATLRSLYPATEYKNYSTSECCLDWQRPCEFRPSIHMATGGAAPAGFKGVGRADRCFRGARNNQRDLSITPLGRRIHELPVTVEKLLYTRPSRRHADRTQRRANPRLPA